MPVLPRSSPSSTLIHDLHILHPRNLANSLQNAYHIIARTTTSLLQPRDGAESIQLLAPRQSGPAVVAIPTQYEGLNSGPAPGAVAGIILGSVAGFLLILWLLWIVSSGSGFIRATDLHEEDVVVRRRSRSRATTARRSHRTEMTSRSSPAPLPRRVVRQEKITRHHDSMPPTPREQSRIRETILVEEERDHMVPERRVDGDDIVEVIEEHSSISVPPPRRKGRRASSGYRRGEYSDF